MNDQPVPNPLAKNPNFNTHKVFAAIGLILIAAIIIIGGIWYYVESQDKSADTRDTTPVKVTTSSAKPSNNTSDETKDLKEYTGSTQLRGGDSSDSIQSVKYSLKHPADFEITADEYGSTNITTKGYILRSGPQNDSEGSVRLYLEGEGKNNVDDVIKMFPNITITDTKLGGLAAKRFVIDYLESNTRELNYIVENIEKNNLSFRFSCFYLKGNTDFEKICDQVASTFKFL